MRIRVKPETLSLAVEKKSFLNSGLIWLRWKSDTVAPSLGALRLLDHILFRLSASCHVARTPSV